MKYLKYEVYERNLTNTLNNIQYLNSQKKIPVKPDGFHWNLIVTPGRPAVFRPSLSSPVWCSSQTTYVNVRQLELSTRELLPGH